MVSYCPANRFDAAQKTESYAVGGSGAKADVDVDVEKFYKNLPPDGLICKNSLINIWMKDMV